MFVGLLKAGFQSGSIMTCSDLVTQLGIEGRTGEVGELAASKGISSTGSSATTERYDPIRSVRWFSAGLCVHGPYVHLFYGWVDRLRWSPVSTASSILAKKTAVVVGVGLPLYLGLLFTFFGLIEHSSSSTGGSNIDNRILPSVAHSVKEKLEAKFPQAFFGGCTFWPAATYVNFTMVPLQFRVVFVASCSGVYNCFLSWFNEQPKEYRLTWGVLVGRNKQ